MVEDCRVPPFWKRVPPSSKITHKGKVWCIWDCSDVLCLLFWGRGLKTVLSITSCCGGLEEAVLISNNIYVQSEPLLPAQLCALLEMHKVNTTTYHPQCEEFFENFNRILQAMIAQRAGCYWDMNLHAASLACLLEQATCHHWRISIPPGLWL